MSYLYHHSTPVHRVKRSQIILLYKLSVHKQLLNRNVCVITSTISCHQQHIHIYLISWGQMIFERLPKDLGVNLMDIFNQRCTNTHISSTYLRMNEPVLYFQNKRVLKSVKEAVGWTGVQNGKGFHWVCQPSSIDTLQGVTHNNYYFLQDIIKTIICFVIFSFFKHWYTVNYVNTIRQYTNL